MIQCAKKEDLEAVYRLINILENKTMNHERFKEVYLASLERKDVFYYIYISDDKIIGFISLYLKNLLHHDHLTGEIVELIVDPDYRNLKVGEKLIDHVSKKADELGLEELELCTSTWRKDAHRFYENHGFVMNHYNYIKKMG